MMGDFSDSQFCFHNFSDFNSLHTHKKKKQKKLSTRKMYIFMPVQLEMLLNRITATKKFFFFFRILFKCVVIFVVCIL